MNASHEFSPTSLQFVVLTACVLAACSGTVQPEERMPEPTKPSHREAVQVLLQPALDARVFDGLAVAIIEPSGVETMFWGEAAPAKPVDTSTVFEIGSITKVFTSILLMDAVQRGELELQLSLASLLKDATALTAQPSVDADWSSITLEQLATHHSGLARLPAPFEPPDYDNPYAHLREEDMLRALREMPLAHPVGQQYAYSNFAVGLLGQLIAMQRGQPYEELLQARVLVPLGLLDTHLQRSAYEAQRLAVPHDADGREVSAWDFGALQGCGALRSTLPDMIRFVQLAMGLESSTLASALQQMQVARLPAEGGQSIGLGWHISPSGIVWHNGGTGGFRSFVGYSPEHAYGVVVLSNTATGMVDALASALMMHLEGAPAKLDVDPWVELPAQTLQRYEGQYELAPGVIFDIRREGQRLSAQLSGQPAVYVYPESETLFNYRVVPAQLVFAEDASSLTLLQNGLELPAKRLSE
ncbi:MAG: serine hydrolase [Myxococcota bacterium]|jgi:CubicO group peptidase (beta-lactamase class C family)|nr:serine hydrolase [Myxococcota bacterium]